MEVLGQRIRNLRGPLISRPKPPHTKFAPVPCGRGGVTLKERMECSAT
jgi:hypothetical protein